MQRLKHKVRSSFALAAAGWWGQDSVEASPEKAARLLRVLDEWARAVDELLAATGAAARGAVAKFHQTYRVRHALFAVQTAFFAGLVVTSVVVAAHGTPAARTLAPKLAAHEQPAIVAANAANSPQSNGGLKFGVYTSQPNPKASEQKLGTKVNMTAWFTHWGESLAGNKLQYACDHGYAPVITWESWAGRNGSQTASTADIAAGKYDAYITKSLRQVHDTCGDQAVTIRFDHEMDTPVGVVDWYPWQGDPQAYIAAWQHVVNLARPVDTHIKWLWSPNRGTEVTKAYYPGDQYVDFVGLTLNHTPLTTQYQSFQQFYEGNQTVIESFNKPIIIAETTSAEEASNKAVWVRDMFGYLRGNKRMVGVLWFNGPAQEPTYGLASSPATLDAFRQALQPKQGGEQ